MKTAANTRWKHLLFAPLLLSLAVVAAPAMADDDDDDRRGRWHHYDDDDDDDRRRWRGRDRRWDYGDRDHDRRRWDRDERRAYTRGYYDGRRHDRYRDDRRHWRGAPPWARGRDYRSYGYRQVYYVPADYYPRYRLYRPPYGHRWVRDDHDNFLLVAAATGIIAHVLTR